MVRTTTTKKMKPKPAKHKSNNQNALQTAMPKGSNGKFDVLYRSTLSLHADKKTEDLTPKAKGMTQHNNNCTAGYKCKAGMMPLSTLHCCIVCAFCLHPECGHELSETPTDPSVYHRRRLEQVHPEQRNLLEIVQIEQIYTSTVSEHQSN